ncbi:MAG: hypothetical protein WBG86_05170, partial [Polyangiales bacterium]
MTKICHNARALLGNRPRIALLLVLSLATIACGESGGIPIADGGTDAGTDAGADAGMEDAGTDAGTDAGADAGTAESLIFITSTVHAGNLGG